MFNFNVSVLKTAGVRQKHFRTEMSDVFLF